MPKFIVSYELPHLHTVRVGIEAPDVERAREIAREKLDDGTLWDNTAEMPLLTDDFNEVDDGTVLEFEAQPVTDWPQPDASVGYLVAHERALRAAQLLAEAYAHGEARGGEMDWDEVGLAYEVAIEALKAASIWVPQDESEEGSKPC